MFYREKAYTRINWKNRPNLSTPLGAKNLNKMDATLNELDDRIIEVSSEVERDSLTIGFISDKVNALKENVDENTSQINELSNLAEDVNGLKIVSTASGSTAYMDDASNMKIEDIDFYGESKQLQTTGAQLVDIADFTLVKPDTRTKSISFETIEAGTYNLNVKLQGTAEYVGVRFVGVDGTNYTAIQLKDGNNVLTCDGQADKFWFFIAQEQADGVTANISDVMLSVEPLPYEKYTGRKPSPNPDYPQPIESKIVNRVDVLGKNLLKFPYYDTTNKVTEGVTFITNSDETITVNGTSTGDAYLELYNNPNEMLVNEPIIFSKGAVNTVTLFYFERIDGRWSVGQNTTESQTEINITPSANATGQIFRLTVQSGKTANNIKVYPMIRPSFFTDGTYEPYQSQTVNLSEPIELNGIGDVRDSSKLKKFGVVVLDGSDDEGWWSSGSVAKRYCFTSSSLNQNTKMLCTQAKYLYNSQEVNTFFADGLHNFIINTSFASLAEWKTHLQSNPMTVVYELAEPIETELPQADIDAIKQLHTYKPNTVVMNGADAEMDVHYVADPRLYVDKKFEALASAIVNQQGGV